MSQHISTGVSGKFVQAMYGVGEGWTIPADVTTHLVSGKCYRAMYGVGEGWTIPHDVTTYLKGSLR